MSQVPVNYVSGFENTFISHEKIVEELSQRFAMPVYRYHAYELRITSDLQIYQVVRRVIVPANIELEQFHAVLQCIFGWEDCHLHAFTVFDVKSNKSITRLTPDEKAMEYDQSELSSIGNTLSEFLNQNSYLLYTYDFGDCWEHKIELIRDIPQHNERSPYLLEATGKAPPENVGGVGGFVALRKILLDTKHPEQASMKQWAGLWMPSLSEWERTPRAIEC